MELETRRIERMLKEGKITKEEANKLLKALPHPEKKNQKRNRRALLSALTTFVIILTAALGLFFSRRQAASSDRQKINTAGVLQMMEMPMDYVSSQGEMLLVLGGKKLALPLTRTSVTGTVDGFLARITVAQTFVNPMDTTLEAVYTFPLPENSAVDSMVMTIGKKRIKGVIKERGEARAIYEQARREGRTAGLLEQERPDIFTQSVANILRGDTILITISYVQELKYRKGKYGFYFPMVVGPRYIPGTPLRPENQGTEPPTDQVPDAHRITPPIVPPAFRSGHEIALSLTLRTGVAVKELESPSHKIKVRTTDSGSTVELEQNDRIPNKDFMLEYAVAGKEIQNVLLTHRTRNQDGFLQLIMIPRADKREKDIFPRELVFVIDNSGSMMGFPIEKCKTVIRLSLENMRKDDLFNVMKFSGWTGMLWPESKKATEDNVKAGLGYIDQMEGGGGTEMLAAINALFDMPRAEGRRRLVLFLTDGYVGNDGAILTAVRQRLGESRVFSLGVGSSVNRYLMEGLAYAGKGACLIIRQDGDAQKTMEDFFEFIDAPALTDITLQWNGVEAMEPQPVSLPDLFFGQPLVVTAKYKKAGRGTLVIRGKLAREKSYETSIDIDLPEEENSRGVLATLWARKKIKEIELLGNGLFGENTYTPEQVKEDITRLGLAYKIMTKYTSFVAVDDAIRNKDGKWVTMEQQVEMPEGVSPKSQPEHRFGERKAQVYMQLFAVPSEKEQSVGTKYNIGYGGGGGAGGVDDLLAGLGGSGATVAGLTKRANVELPSSKDIMVDQSALGGRHPEDIYRVVMQHIGGLRTEYNKRLRAFPNLKGKITVRLTIDSTGAVIRSNWSVQRSMTRFSNRP